MSNRSYLSLAFAGLTALAIALPAYAQPSTIIIAPTAPPPVRVETMPPPSPGGTLSWQAGRWAWVDGNWQWMDGRYVQGPQPNAVWVPGHWDQYSSGGYNWVDGHWQS